MTNHHREVRLFDHRFLEDADGAPLGIERVQVGQPLTNVTRTDGGGLAGWAGPADTEKEIQ